MTQSTRTDLKQKILKVFLGLVTLIALVVIGEIWFDILDSNLFVKILATIFVIGGLLVAYMIITDSMEENKKLKDDNYMN
jgi:flagellar motor component MotA